MRKKRINLAFSILVLFLLTLSSCKELTKLLGLNEAPTADAGADQSGVVAGTTVTLDGTRSRDAESDPLTFKWSFSAVPLDSTMSDFKIQNATSTIAYFTPDKAGSYVVVLTVSDGTSVVTDSVTIEVVPAANAGLLQFSTASLTVGEDAGSVSISVTRTGGSTGAVGVAYVTSDGTAAAGSDYTATSGTLSWASGETGTKSFGVSIIDDAVSEGSETFTVALNGASGGATVGTPGTATVTIADNESPTYSGLQLSAAGYTVNENWGSVSISVTRTGGGTGAVGVAYVTSDGTAAAGSDYTATSGTLSWASGETGTKSFSVSIIDDTTYEGGETFTVALSSASGGAVIGSPGTATVTIADNESPTNGSLQFSAVTYLVNENGGSVSISVTRTGGGTGAVGIAYVTSDGTAAAGSDYVAASGTLSWASGETGTKSFSVSITDDATYEGNEIFSVALNGPSGGATIGSPGIAAVTIVDNESPTFGSLQFSAASYTVNENAGSVSISVTRTGGSAGAVGVGYAFSNGSAAAGSDYTAVSGTLSWVSGETGPKSFSVSVIDDTTYEGNEIFIVALNSPSGGATVGSPGTATVTIVDNESPTYGSLQLSASSYTVNENGGSVGISVTRTGGSAGAVGVGYATSSGTAAAGSDYAVASGTLSWASGEAGPKSFSVSITDDTTYEGSETFTVALSNASGGATVGSPGTATVTILDNESPAYGSLQFGASSYMVSEIAGYVSVFVNRLGGSTGAVGVSYATGNGTATAGSDYTATSGTLSWADGEAGTKSFYVSIGDDATYEGNETFTVALSAPTGGATIGVPGTTTVTIVENEVPVPGVVFEDDFETYPVGAFPYSAGWQMLYGGYGGNLQIVTDSMAVVGSKSLQLEGAPSNSANAMMLLPSTPQTVFLEVYVKAVKLDSSIFYYDEARFGFYNPDAAAWGQYYATVSFWNDGTIRFGDYDAASYPTIGTWEENVWYKVKIRFDKVALTGDVWINDTQVVTNVDLSGVGGNYTSIVLVGGNDTHTRAWFDGVRVTGY